MKGKHPLITHPVGRMRTAARWYLAAVAMMTLVLVAIHFAMQVYAQEEAKRLVGEWQDRSGISVSDVRYRMLRGALTLIDVRFVEDGLQARLPMLFLQGNLTSLTADQPHTSAIEIRNAQLSMTIPAFERALADTSTSLFVKLWRSAQSVAIHETSIDLLPDPESPYPGSASRIELVRLMQEADASQRKIKAVAHMFEGELEVNALADSDGESMKLRRGRVSWSDCDMAGLLSGLAGLEPLIGRSSGLLDWYSDIDNPDVVIMSGTSGINAFEGSPRKALLKWEGKLNHGIWQGRGQAAEWPLVMFTGQLPKFRGLSAVDGRVDGTFTLSGSLRNWRLSLEKGQLNDLRFRGKNGLESLPELRIDSTDITNVEIKWPEKRAKIAEARLDGAVIELDTSAIAPDQEWRIAIDRLLFTGLTSTISWSGKEILLPAMQGEASLSQTGRFKLRLNSGRADKVGMPTANDENEEKWNVSGDGDLFAVSTSRFSANIEARSVPLVRFRALLPEPIRNNASSITGDAELKLNLVAAGADAWEFNGRAEVSDAALHYRGDQWSGRRASIEIERIGTGLPLQLIRSIEVDGWQYQAALTPLPSPGAETGVEEASGSKAEPWHIKKIELRNGGLSVGQADAVWLNDIQVRISDLFAGHAAPVELKAGLDGGAISVDGTLAWESALPTLAEARISVRDALPFFMNDWLAISGAPRIVRGRFYADVSVSLKESGEYDGMGYLRLQHGQLGPALSSDDPMLQRIGMNSHDLFSVLQAGGRIRMQVPVRGSGELLDVFGASFIDTIKRTMEKKKFSPSLKGVKEGDLLSSVRLHESGSFSHNERTRLRTIVRYLKKNSKSVIELKPKLSSSSPLEEQYPRVRYTQQLIEGFLGDRGISRSRIFPVWPVEQHRSAGSSSGVGIVTLP